MKKKYREITVGGETYAWAITNINGDGDGGCGVRVWKDKKLLIDVWHEHWWPNVTPRTVAQLILAKDEKTIKEILEFGTDKPYLEEEEYIIHYHYNPYYGDDRICKCGHSYYRHFDTYEEMANIGCKYCGCQKFEEDPDYRECKMRHVNQYRNEEGNLVCKDCRKVFK